MVSPSLSIAGAKASADPARGGDDVADAGAGAGSGSGSGGPRPLGQSAPDGPSSIVSGLLDGLIEGAGEGIFEWDIRSGRIWYSRRWKMLLGYDEDLPDSPDLWRVLSHPDELAEVDKLLRDHLVDFWPFTHTWRMRHHNGDWRWILWRGASLRDPSGETTFMLALCTDITDHVGAEERQRALATAIPDLMLRLRVDGVVLDEKRAVVAPNLSFPIAVGARLDADGAAEEWVREAIEATRAAVETGAVVARALEAEHGTAFLELRAVRSGPDEAVCIIRDVTERSIAERRQHDLQVEVAAMHEAERKRLAGELAIAAHIQTSLLPTPSPIDNLEICWQMLPATEVGGDYFDVRACHHGAWLAIGDVSGHGLNAGIIMLMVQSAIASLVIEDPLADPSAVLRTANRVLYENIRGRLKTDDFITLTLLRYFSDGRLIFAGAHEDLLILRAADGRVDQVTTPGTWLGVMQNLGRHVEETEQRLRPGDLLVLYTDGITEARDDAGAQFGVGRLISAIREAREQPIEGIRDHVQRAVSAWTSRREDDMSLVVARYVPGRQAPRPGGGGTGRRPAPGSSESVKGPMVKGVS